jgi:hypothetical protein
MITLCHASPAATGQWSDLASELDCWGAEGRIATLWWRDDDAAAPCDRLDRQLAIAGEVPVALAVIPATAQPELAARLGDDAGRPSPQHPRVAILQHGWNHTDHGSATGAKKSEFPAERSPATVAADLLAGGERLRALFGDRALPILAPPWNRLAETFLALLPGCGIGAISRVNPRGSAWPAPGVFAANVHVDLVAWKKDRGFIGEATALGGLIQHLRARRCGEVDHDEPTGILTHHLVQDKAAGDFLMRLVALTGAHRAVRWLGADEVFAPGLGAAAAAAPPMAVPA